MGLYHNIQTKKHLGKESIRQTLVTSLRFTLLLKIFMPPLTDALQSSILGRSLGEDSIGHYLGHDGIIISWSRHFDKTLQLNFVAGTPFREDFIGHSSSSASDVIATLSCDSQNLSVSHYGRVLRIRFRLQTQILQQFIGNYFSGTDDVIITWWRNFGKPSYLQLWIDYAHQIQTARHLLQRSRQSIPLRMLVMSLLYGHVT